MKVAVIDYGSGNLRSAAKALERAAAELGDGSRVAVTREAAEVAAADRIVLPGVGAFADCRAGLVALPGMVEAMEDAVRRRGRPFLGICVGMQLLATWGREHGDTPGLDWIPGEVVPLTPSDSRLKIPHMGWNELSFSGKSHVLLEDLKSGAHAYFVHSYSFRGDPADVVATVDYGGSLTAMIARANIAGTQFHPEKSQATGLKLLSNFLRWAP